MGDGKKVRAVNVTASIVFYQTEIGPTYCACPNLKYVNACMHSYFWNAFLKLTLLTCTYTVFLITGSGYKDMIQHNLTKTSQFE